MNLASFSAASVGGTKRLGSGRSGTRACHPAYRYVLLLGLSFLLGQLHLGISCDLKAYCGPVRRGHFLGKAMRDLAGKTAFVTGAASGIGFGIATALAQAGVKVMLCDIEEAALTKAAADQRRQAVRDQARPAGRAERALGQHSEVGPTKVSLDTLAAPLLGQLRPKISAKYQSAATITTKPPTSVRSAWLDGTQHDPKPISVAGISVRIQHD